jgi:uncharacterized coiled-coil protein SlyX
MGLFDSTKTHRFDPGFIAAINRIAAALEALTNVVTTQGRAIMNDLTVLTEKITALEAKSAETVTTLGGLAQAVIDLKNSGDVQAGIDALAARAQVIVDNLTAAEDAADDQLPGA